MESVDTALSRADAILARSNNAKMKHRFSKRACDYTKVLKLQAAAEQAQCTMDSWMGVKGDESAEGNASAQGEMFKRDGILHNSNGTMFKAPEGFLLVVEEDTNCPRTQIYKLMSYGEASMMMLARSTPEQSPTVQLSISSHHGTPAEGPSAPVSPAKSGIPTPPAPSSLTKRVMPVQTAPGSLARSIMPEVPAPGSPLKSSTPILTVTQTLTSCKHFSSDMARFWQAKSKQQDVVHRICQELETRPHARKKILCHPTTPQMIELAKGKGRLLSFFATDTTKVTMVMTELQSLPKVCRVTLPSLKGKPLGSLVQTQTSPCQPLGSMTSLASTVVVSAMTEEKGTPHTMQIERPPPPPPSGGTTASSQASTPLTQPIRMTDPPASPSQCCIYE